VFREAFRAWQDDGAPSMGAALSYYTLFSIAPLILIVVAIAGLVFGDEAARGEIFEQLTGLLGREGAQAIEDLVLHANRPAAGTLAMLGGMVALVLGAMGVFGELQNSLDRIWRAPTDKHMSGWLNVLRSRLLSFAMILAIAFVLMVSLVAGAIASAIGGWWMLDAALSFAITTLLFALIYKIIPRVRIRWGDVWVGAAVTAALFAVGKVLIGLYLGRAAVASAFGVAGSLVVVMVWVYYSAQVFLLGAEFTRVYAARMRACVAAPSESSPRTSAA
jgi:membrane protein